MNNINSWKQYKHLQTFFSQEENKYFIVFDTGITSLGPTKEFPDLNAAVLSNRIIAAERLMYALGYTNIEKIKDIIKENENFATVDGKYFLARSCSTLKILVGIKKEYLTDEFLNKYGISNSESSKNKQKEIEGSLTLDPSQILKGQPLFDNLKDQFNSVASNNNIPEQNCSPNQIVTNPHRILEQTIYASENVINAIKQVSKMSNLTTAEIKKSEQELLDAQRKRTEDDYYESLSVIELNRLKDEQIQEKSSILDALGQESILSEEEISILTIKANELAREKAKKLAIEENPTPFFTIPQIVDSPSLDITSLLYNKDDPKVKAFLDGNTDSKDLSLLLGTIDFKVVLADTLKCLALTSTDLNLILEKFGSLKKYIDEFLKWYYTDEICEPLLLNKIFDALKFISIPYIPTYNPRGNAFNIIEDLIKKLITESVSYLIRNAISAQCNKDNLNTDPNRPAAAALNASLDDLFGDDSFNSFLENDINTASQDKINQLKNDLNNFIRDSLLILSDKELCNLMNGKPLTSEGYEVLESLLNRKYEELSKYLNSRTKIHVIFSKINDAAIESGLNIQFCDDLAKLSEEQNGNDTPVYDILCRTKQADDLRKELLANKGLTPDEITQQLNDIDDGNKKNLEDFAKALNGNLDALNNIPFFCRDRDVKTSKSGNPTTEPSFGKNSVITNTLKTAANSTFNKLYDVFDSEIKTYNKFYTFDVAETNGGLQIDQNGNMTFIGSTDESEKSGSIKKIYTVGNVLFNSSGSILNSDYSYTFDIDHSVLKATDKISDIELQNIIVNTVLYEKEKQFKNAVNIHRLKLFELFGGDFGNLLNSAFNLTNINKTINTTPYEYLTEIYNYNYSDIDWSNSKVENIIQFIKKTDRMIDRATSIYNSSMNRYTSEYNQLIKAYDEYKLALQDTNSIDTHAVYNKIQSLYPKYNLNYKYNTSDSELNTTVKIAKNDNDFIKINNITKINIKDRVQSLQELVGNDIVIKPIDLIKAEHEIIKKFENEYKTFTNNYFKVTKSYDTKRDLTTYSALLDKLSLFLDYEECGESANILNISSIKNRVIDIMSNESCFTQPPVDQNQKKNNLSDYENASLYGIVLLFIRLNVLECLIKGIFPYSVYKIESFDNDLLVDFILLFTEKEIKKLGFAFEIKFMDSLVDLYKNQQKTAELPNLTSRQALKLFIKEEINFHLDNSVKIKPTNFRNVYDKFIKDNNIIQKDIFDEEYVIYEKILLKDTVKTTTKVVLKNNILSFYKNDVLFNTKQVDSELILKNIYFIKDYMSILTINSILSSWSARPQFNIFLKTKINLKNSFEIVTSDLNGKYTLEKPSLETLMATGTFDDFILQAILRTGVNIFKAFCEGGDPNISVASKLYLGGKIINPDLPLGVLPLTSIGLMFFIFPTPFTIAYDAIVGAEAIAELSEITSRKEKENQQIANFVKSGQVC